MILSTVEEQDSLEGGVGDDTVYEEMVATLKGGAGNIR